jgi:hypothetical protein
LTGEIHRLSDDTVRRLTAEQAISDLAGIVKELVDNSLDAESTTIKGKRYQWGEVGQVWCGRVERWGCVRTNVRFQSNTRVGLITRMNMLLALFEALINTHFTNLLSPPPPPPPSSTLCS